MCVQVLSILLCVMCLISFVIFSTILVFIGDIILLVGFGVMILALIIIYCLLAWFGALSKCIFSVPAVYLLFLMVMQLFFAVFLYTHHHEALQQVQEEFKSLWENRDNPTSMETINIIQQNFQCCGYDSYQDYKTYVPPSCCPKDVKICYSFRYFTKGCKQELAHIAHGVLFWIVIICFVLVALETFTMFWTCYISSVKPKCHDNHC